jgi:hypothetical protein
MKTTEEFLEELRKELSFLGDGEAAEVIEEMRSHIIDAAAASGKSLEEVVASMAPPEEIARSFREEFGSSGADEDRPDGSEEKKGKKDDWTGDWRFMWRRWRRYCGPGRCGPFFSGARGSEKKWREMGEEFERFGKGMAEVFGGKGPCGPWHRGDWEVRMRRVFDTAFSAFASGEKRESPSERDESEPGSP